MPRPATRDLPTGLTLSQAAALIRIVYVGREPTVSWRVTAGNGRILGASVSDFAAKNDAGADLQHVRTRVAELVPNYSHPRSGVGWTWVAGKPDGTPLAQSARAYERRATCVTGYERFISALTYLGVQNSGGDQPNRPLT